MHAGLDRLHRIMLIVERRGGTSQVIDFLHFDIQRKGHIVNRIGSKLAVE
jgi:hypothetical protein